MALAASTETSLSVAGVVYSILFLDWLAMLAAHIIVRWLGPLLLLLGVVLGVTQVALGLQLMMGGISGLIGQGAFTGPEIDRLSSTGTLR
jgi:small neutral amino acid transporter SnatA (MarC family)